MVPPPPLPRPDSMGHLPDWDAERVDTTELLKDLPCFAGQVSLFVLTKMASVSPITLPPKPKKSGLFYITFQIETDL